METKGAIQRTAFCCAHHGAITGPVEYFSVDLGSRRLVDVPLMFCSKCKKYYTPYTNLLAFAKPWYKGHQIAAAQGRVEKSFPRVETRVPHFVSVGNEEVRKTQKDTQDKEKRRQYFESLRKVEHNCLTLTNKPCFTEKRLCPHCQCFTQKERVKIVKDWKSLLAQVRNCKQCDTDYITPKQFYALNEKMQKIARECTGCSFIRPQNVECEYDGGDKYLFIPKWMLDFERFGKYALPKRNDEYYDMTDEEYLWVKMFYIPDEFPVKLRQRSFLSAEGYSANESESLRHRILARCVDKYGKNKVINQLKFNINLRIRQKGGESRYECALNIWRGDIWYVENEL